MVRRGRLWRGVRAKGVESISQFRGTSAFSAGTAPFFGTGARGRNEPAEGRDAGCRPRVVGWPSASEPRIEL